MAMHDVGIPLPHKASQAYMGHQVRQPVHADVNSRDAFGSARLPDP
jgi:hypothetical protein